MNKATYQFKDIIVVGFALFAMLFGAGNLIFPPDLGVHSGTQWFVGFLFYFFADLGLGVIAILAMIRFRGDVHEVAAPLGKVLATAIATAIILCIGPGLAIPRTAATTYELGIVPLLGIEVGKGSLAILSVVFFAVVLILTIRPNKVVDIIGNILTPVLLISIVILIIKGILTPAGSLAEVATDSPVREGIYNGYQTIDMLASIFFAVIILSSIREKGYGTDRAVSAMTIRASVVAGAIIFFIYGGLTYLGASSGSTWQADVLNGTVNQAGLLINITQALLGRPGIAVLSVVVASACLTTAIGLVAAAVVTFLISILEVGGGTFGNETCARLDGMLPFSTYGFSWLIPGAVVFIIAAAVTSRKK